MPDLENNEAQPKGNKPNNDLFNFLDKDYERKINYLLQQFARMWTRFNFFITLESSLIAGKLIFKADPSNQWFAWVGLGLSICWYVFGANDKQLVNVYKYGVEKAAEKIISLVDIEKVYVEDKYYYVGKADIKYKDVRGEDDRNELKMGLLHWRLKLLSITHLASAFPLLLVLAWLIYLIKLL